MTFFMMAAIMKICNGMECVIMAEQFQKPKQFSGEWFAYVWHYYKIHIISAIAVLVLCVITVMEIAGRINYDMSMHYVATNIIEFETAERIAQLAEENVDDITKDEEVHVSFSQINFTPEAMQDGNQIMALENKLMSLFASTDEMLFLFDEMMLRDVLSMNATEGIFLPVVEWCQQEMADENLYKHDGTAYAVKLSDSVFFKELGIDASNIYVAVRMNYKPEDKKTELMLQNCIKFANDMVN